MRDDDYKEPEYIWFHTAFCFEIIDERTVRLADNEMYHYVDLRKKDLAELIIRLGDIYYKMID